ncbi:hypothetical protein [Bordetella avium]|uniref:Uncharacterized protein n=1 Tax=Bordetella avium (strain 197N) TaxID=360910 RepID=Q2L181_BORA1|nr:hypothetical protein [Bordetella avium]AZY49093.1 hypothetical protein C0J09_08005 [Bordetella avium]AZY52450.1 hypothetical protein C0J07_07990 [Bordetella avium]RIQ12244.1 hypothetical protein D0432_13405 [Bordetella avium]RIQ19385.1 hypothetical protein D0850_04880 [Bordetella avium]RIQ33554.1 hypothetical protein D0849_11570 [Bordetella avium]
MPQRRPSLAHTELLNDATEIASILKAAIQPGHEAQARDGQGRLWPLKLMGCDWQAGIFFWRPRDLEQTRLQPGGMHLLTGNLAVELLISLPDDTRLQFQTNRPIVLSFSDDSVSMVSEFPAQLRRDTPYSATA